MSQEYKIKCKDGSIHEIKPGDHWISIAQGMSGHFAVELWLNDKDSECPFPEPWQTGIGRYKTPEEAFDEATYWAEGEELPLEAR